MPKTEPILSAEEIDRVQALLAHAKGLGADEVEVGVSGEQGYSLVVRAGQTESLEYHSGRGASIAVMFGHASGTASTTDLSQSALSETLEKACSMAKFAHEDPCAGLASREEFAFDYPDLDCDHPWGLTPNQAMSMAQAAEAEAMAQPGIICTEGVSISTARSHGWMANSMGFVGEQISTSHSMNCVTLAGEDDKQRDYEYTASRRPELLMDAQVMAVEAARRTVNRLGAKPLSSRQVPVVFEPRSAKSLIGHALSAIRGGALYRKSTFLLDALGQQIFPDWMKIEDLPHLPGQLGSVPYDSEGVRTQNRTIVEDGILQTYLLDVYSARQLGLKSTGHAGGNHTTRVKPSAKDLDLPSLLNQMHTGLLVTELMGQGVNLLTGDYSRGAFGYWVENGEVQYPVTGITLAGNLRDIFLGLQAIGSDIDQRSRVETGSILVESMMVAGQ